MRRTKLASVAALAAAALTLAACGSSSEPAATPTPSATTSSAAPTSEEPMPAAKDIVDTAVGAGQFTTLATALTAAGLVDTLKGAGPFTVFAPTDDAFAKLPAGTLDTLLADPKGALTKILTYHVVPGKVMAADVVKMDGAKVKTVNGAELTTALGSTIGVRVFDARYPIVMLKDQDPNDINPFLNPRALDINKGNKQIAHGILFVLRPANL